MEIGEKLNTEFGEVVVEQYLGKGKSGYSYLVDLDDTKYVLKIMHDEKINYYEWSKSKISAEIESYKILSQLNIPLPKLHFADFEKNFLIKDFIDGQIASEIIAENKISEEHIKKLFSISNHLKKNNLNVDYFPNNFVLKNDDLFYIDYEHNPYDKNWSLENWGIYYWVNSKGFNNFLETGDARFINIDLEKGIPIKEPFQDRVNDWIKKYSDNMNE